MTLALAKQRAATHAITVPELLGLLRQEAFDAIEANVRVMRETFPCPFTVPDYDGFKACITAFWAHYNTAFFGADRSSTGVPLASLERQWAVEFLERHLGGAQELRRAERNSIAGRDGGLIAVIDAMAEAILKFQTELYIRTVFFELVAPSDYDTRLRLAEELLARFGPLLFPGEQLVPAWVIGHDLEAFVKAFITYQQGLRRQWRR